MNDGTYARATWPETSRPRKHTGDDRHDGAERWRHHPGSVPARHGRPDRPRPTRRGLGAVPATGRPARALWTAIGTDTSAPYSIPWITTGPAHPTASTTWRKRSPTAPATARPSRSREDDRQHRAGRRCGDRPGSRREHRRQRPIALAATAADATAGVGVRRLRGEAYRRSLVHDRRCGHERRAVHRRVDTHCRDPGRPGRHSDRGHRRCRQRADVLPGRHVHARPDEPDRGALPAPADVSARRVADRRGSADIDHVDYAYAAQGSGSWSPIGTGRTHRSRPPGRRPWPTASTTCAQLPSTAAETRGKLTQGRQSRPHARRPGADAACRRNDRRRQPSR